MKIMVMRVGDQMLPAYEDDQKAFKSIPKGQPLQADVKLYPNIKLFRKCWCLAGYVADHHPAYPNKEIAMEALKIAAGHCTMVPNPTTGEIQAIPKSISFDAMAKDPDGFQKFYESAVDGAIKYLAEGMAEDAQQLNQIVEELAGF